MKNKDVFLYIILIILISIPVYPVQDNYVTVSGVEGCVEKKVTNMFLNIFYKNHSF